MLGGRKKEFTDLQLFTSSKRQLFQLWKSMPRVHKWTVDKLRTAAYCMVPTPTFCAY